ncbi:MAG TPA: hypothetical protein VF913_00335 [Xanthobacteraceae bacterium]
MIELRHLQPDIAGADHREPVGQLGRVEPIPGVDVVDLVETLDRRDDTARARIEHHLSRRHALPADADPETIAVLAFKSSVGFEQVQILGTLQPLLQPSARFHDDGFGSFKHRREVDLDGWNAQSELAGPAGKMRDARRGDRRLGRRAAEVDARPPDILALGERDMLAALRKGNRQAWAGLPGTDDQDFVVSVRHWHSPSPFRAPVHRAGAASILAKTNQTYSGLTPCRHPTSATGEGCAGSAAHSNAPFQSFQRISSGTTKSPST